MFWFNLLIVVLGTVLLDARHVPITRQRGSGPRSSPRFIVIRPPAGMGQGNRVIVLANPRFIPSSRMEPTERRSPASSTSPRLFTPSATRRGTTNIDSIRTGSQVRRTGAAAVVDPRTPSLRDILQRRQSRARTGVSSVSNIARLSDTIPRALPPLTSKGKRFGELNMPSAIEMALNRLRQQAQQASGGLGAPRIPSHGPRTGDQASSHFGLGLLDLSGVQVNGNARGTARAAATSTVTKETNQSRVSTSKQSKTISHTSSGSAQAIDSSVISKSTTSTKSETVAANATATTDIKSQTSSTAAAGGSGVSASASVDVKSSAKATNTTTSSKKSVKSRTIKVTTVVKGNDPASVAAATANQKAVANAVASGGALPAATPSPVGSISVHRSPDGISTITLSDGQGEPVILRARGPVKIERVISPSGKIQFVINPMTPTGEEVEIEPEDMLTTPATLQNPTAVRHPNVPHAIPRPASSTSVNPGAVIGHHTANLAGVQEHRSLAQSETRIVQTISKSATSQSEQAQVQQQQQTVASSGQVVISATSKTHSEKSASKQTVQSEHAHAQAQQQSVGGSGQMVSNGIAKSNSEKSASISQSEHSHTQHKQQSVGSFGQVVSGSVSKSHTNNSATISQSQHSHAQQEQNAIGSSGQVISAAISESHSAHEHSHSAGQQSRTQTFISQSPHHDPQGILHPNEVAARQRARAMLQRPDQQQQQQHSMGQQPIGQPSFGHQHDSIPQGARVDSHIRGGVLRAAHKAHRPSPRDATMLHSHNPSRDSQLSQFQPHLHDRQGRQFQPQSQGSVSSSGLDLVQSPSEFQSHPHQPPPVSQHGASGPIRTPVYPASTQSPQRALASFAGSLGSAFPSAAELSKMFASNTSGVSASEFLAALESVQKVLSSMTASPSLMSNTEPATISPIVSKGSKSSSVIDTNSPAPPNRMTTYSPFAPKIHSATSEVLSNRDTHRHVGQLDIASHVLPNTVSNNGHRIGKHSGHIQINGPS